jgi:predicted alpha-1,2-mannosidase
MSSLGNFGVMPVRLSKRDLGGSVKDWILDHKETRVWWSPLDKETEKSTPGQYSVKLTKPDVDASMLATSTLSGVHQYVFNPATSGESYYPGYVFDACHTAKITAGIHGDHDCVNATVVYSEDMSSFSANVLNRRGIWMYIYGEVEAVTSSSKFLSPVRVSTCTNENAEHFLTCTDDIMAPHSSASGELFSRIHFPAVPASDYATLQMRVAMSYVDAENAKLNYQHSPVATASVKASLDPLIDSTRAAWCTALSSVEVQPLEGDDELSIVLYSAAYRSLMTPAVYTEHGGLYRGLDQQIHNVTADRLALYDTDHSTTYGTTMDYYSDFSFWDTFRSQHPWILLTHEPMAIGILRSISEMTQQHGGFPKWVMATVDTGSMVGLHGASACLEAALSGFSAEFDVKGIQQMLLHQATEQWPVNARKDLEHYLTEGWVSDEADDSSTSLTLSYAYDDFVLAGMSTVVGDTTSADEAMTRSKNYANHFSEKYEYVCPRTEAGDMKCPKSATGPDSWTHFIEGDTLHWTTFVPHDPEGLMGLHKSPADFQEKMESFFANHVSYHEEHGSAAPNPYFWMGNEVDSFAVWMFNNPGIDCSRAQYWSREITHLHFTNTPHGVPGNEDYGAMASWLIFASFGFYPQAGTTNYYLGSPRMQSGKVNVVHLDGSSSTISVNTINNSAENVYVEKLMVNGVEYKSPIIDRSVLTSKAGCVLEFHMTNTPASGLCPM